MAVAVALAPAPLATEPSNAHGFVTAFLGAGGSHGRAAAPPGIGTGSARRVYGFRRISTIVTRLRDGLAAEILALHDHEVPDQNVHQRHRHLAERALTAHVAQPETAGRHHGGVSFDPHLVPDREPRRPSSSTTRTPRARSTSITWPEYRENVSPEATAARRAPGQSPREPSAARPQRSEPERGISRTASGACRSAAPAGSPRRRARSRPPRRRRRARSRGTSGVVEHGRVAQVRAERLEEVRERYGRGHHLERRRQDGDGVVDAARAGAPGSPPTTRTPPPAARRASGACDTSRPTPRRREEEPGEERRRRRQTVREHVHPEHPVAHGRLKREHRRPAQRVPSATIPARDARAGSARRAGA